MIKNIDPKLREIGEYLQLKDDAFFIIPEYQRAYTWEIIHCDKLWQDIIEFVENGKEMESKGCYFFGTIIINCQEYEPGLRLIDGQQRTTTFLLLLKALLCRVNTALEKDPNDPDSDGLYRGLQERRRQIMRILYRAEAENVRSQPSREADHKLYQNRILLENFSINETYKDELKIILQADNEADAERRVVKIKYKRKDNRYTNFFRNFKFFCDRVSDLPESELNVIAKTILNNCEVIEIKSWHVEQAIAMFNSLNSKGQPLCDSDVISAELYARAKGRGEEGKFSVLWERLKNITANLDVIDINSLLMQYMYCVRAKCNEMKSKNNVINVTTPGLRRYFMEINKAPLSTPIETCQKLIDLACIWEIVTTYTQISILLKLNENAKLFLATYFCRFSSSDIIKEKVSLISECLLRLFILLELGDFGYSSKRFKTFLFGEAINFCDELVADEKIKDDFDKHIHENWTKEEIRAQLEEYEGNILVYINEYLFAKEKGEELVQISKCDIEHIMPTSGNNLPAIKSDAGMDSQEDFLEHVNKLGNKILLETKINRAIGNEWFRSKVSRALERKEGYVNSKFPIANALVQKYQDTNKPYWKKADINDATQKASERMIRFIFNE